MDKLLDSLKNIKYDINVDCFTKDDLPHIKPETLQLCVQVPFHINAFGNESEEVYHSRYISMIMDDFSQSVVKNILQCVFKNGKKSFIDLTNPFDKMLENTSSRSRKIISKINYDITQRYLVTCGRIGSEYFMDSHSFVNLPFNGSRVSGGMYPIGSIQLGIEREVWIDPFMKWDDNYVLCFDDIRVDVSNFSFSVRNEATIHPKILVTLDLRYELVNPEVFFIYEDGYVENWDIQSIVKQEDRDKKIDYILDENKEFRSDSKFGVYFNNKLEP